jgi:SAM-dependent methyltransferase
MTEHCGDANREQARYWAEEGGPSWVRDEVVYDLMLTPFAEALVDRLAPRPGERILEIGCGFGSTALAIAARGAEVHGVDISPPMIARARERGYAETRVSFAVGDAQTDDLGGPYDAVTSRFGVMFFADPVAAFANFARATRSGGRLVFVCWQPLECNPWMNAASNVIRGLLDDPPPPPLHGAGPFAFGETAYLEQVLSNADWHSIDVAPCEAVVQMGGHDGVEGAVNQALGSSVAKTLLQAGGATLRQRAATILRMQFEAESVDGVVRFPAATWLVSARLGAR